MYPIIGKHWTFVSRIKAGKPIITWNNGNNRLNLTRVEDFAKGMVGLIGNPKAYNEIFNIVGDYDYSWMDVIKTLGEIINQEIRVIDIPVCFYANELNGDNRESLLGGRAKNLVCSNEKLKSVVPGYKTRYTLKEGLKLTLDFYKDHDYYNGFDYVWDAECDRIINKYLLKNEMPKDKSLHFVDYDSSGIDIARRNKTIYYLNYYRDNFCYKLFWMIRNKVHL